MKNNKLKKKEGLVKSSCIRHDKERLRKEMNKALKEMPDGFYYQYEIRVLTQREYIEIQNKSRNIL